MRHQRPRRQDCSHSFHAARSAIIAARHGDVPGAGAGEPTDVSGICCSPRHVDRRLRHGTVARQRDPVLRHRSSRNRRGSVEIRRSQRCGKIAGVIALSIYRVYLERCHGSRRQKVKLMKCATVVVSLLWLSVLTSARNSFTDYSDVQQVLASLTDTLPPELKTSDLSAQRKAWPDWVSRH